jgi:hypothetical protein
MSLASLLKDELKPWLWPRIYGLTVDSNIFLTPLTTNIFGSPIFSGLSTFSSGIKLTGGNGGTAGTLSVYENSGTSSVTFSGALSTPQTVTCSWINNGGIVSYKIPPFHIAGSGTGGSIVSNSNAVPLRIHPVGIASISQVVQVYSNTSSVIGTAIIDNSGTITLWAGPVGTNFNSTGDNGTGFSNIILTYPLV